jgi:TIR domain
LPGIFISYRRDDSLPTAGRLYDRLAKAFTEERVFMDVEGIPAGVDFVDYLDSKLAACDVVLAIIGPHWLDAKNGAGNRRLDDPNDFVRREIATALVRKIPVIPVLIDGSPMPNAEDLPEPLKALARRHALEVRNGQFRQDAERLVERIQGSVNTEPESLKRWPTAGLTAVVVTVSVVLLGSLLIIRMRASNEALSSPAPTEPASFTYRYEFPPDAGVRVWTRDKDGNWLERYPNGLFTRTYLLEGKQSIDGCSGTWLTVRMCWVLKSSSPISAAVQCSYDRNYPARPIGNRWV